MITRHSITRSHIFYIIVKRSRVRLPLDTIMAVSIGEADKSREPLGDQAMEVTGE